MFNQFVLTISLLCKMAVVNEMKAEQCMLYYVNCSIYKQNTYDFKKLRQCAVKRGDNYSEAESNAMKKFNQTDSKD